MSYAPRDYQTDAINAGIKHLTKKDPKPFLLVLPTGAGKSIVIASIAKELEGNVLVLQPSKELISQNYEKFVAYDTGIEVGVYCAGLNRKEIRKVTYATIQSIYRKPELFEGFHYVIIDECHQVNPENIEGRYTSFLKAISCTRVCGLTATPYRLKQRFYYEEGEKFYTAQLVMINRMYPFFFKSIAYKIETDELMQRGYLSPILYRTLDLGGEEELRVNSTGQDYTAESLEQYWANDVRLLKLAQVIEKIDKHCQRNLIFCSSLLQAHRAREMLSKLGIRAELVDGSTPALERDRLVAEYRSGVFKHMLNVGVFTTGFDVPELDSIVCGRATMSLMLWYQMVGRGVRLDPARPEKKLRVYDLVHNTEKHGRIETIKIEKEKGGFRDEVVTERGVVSGVPLFTFAVNKKEDE